MYHYHKLSTKHQNLTALKIYKSFKIKVFAIEFTRVTRVLADDGCISSIENILILRARGTENGSNFVFLIIDFRNKLKRSRCKMIMGLKDCGAGRF